MHKGVPLIVSGLINPCLSCCLKIMVPRAIPAARLVGVLGRCFGTRSNPSGEVGEN